VRFQNRARVSIEQFAKTYYSQTDIPQHVIRDALQRIEMATDIPAELLRPTDRFAIELAPPRGWEYDDGLITFSAQLRRDAAAAGVDLRFENVNTIDDYIHVANRLWRSSATDRTI
jgi:hypothetical protein